MVSSAGAISRRAAALFTTHGITPSVDD